MGKSTITAGGCLLLGALWGWFSCGPASREQASHVPELPQLNRSDFSDTIWPVVESAYRKAQSQPGSSDAAGRLGMALHAFDQYMGALEAYRRAHALEPEALRWRYYEAVVLESLGRDGEAIDAFQEALDIDPGYLPARIRMAGLLLRAGRIDEAEKIYTSVAGEHPEAAGAHYGLGQVQTARGEHARAITHLRRACDAAPNFGRARYALALALRAAGESTASELEMALYQSSDHSASPPLDDPLIDAVTAVKAESQYHHIEEGRRLEAAGALEEAAQEYRRALEIDPQSVQAHVNLLSVYGTMGDYKRAEKHYHEALRINPEIEEAHYNYANVLTLRGRPQEAVEAYEKALALNPNSSESHNNLGYALETLGRRREAVRHYEQALRHQPDHRLAHYHLGRNLALDGEYAQAISHLEQAASGDDERTPRMLYELARVHETAGNGEAAKRYRERARRLAVALGQKEVVALIDEGRGGR